MTTPTLTAAGARRRGRTLRLGTRGSALARAQADAVAAALRGRGCEVEILTVRTLGDDHAADVAWGEGAFVTAIERALQGGEVDLAVHSAKDLPTEEPDELWVAAFLPRADPRDALVGPRPGFRLADLPQGARVGTDSPRRSGFLRHLRPDLRPHPLNGNVDRRLERLAAGETDALILAVAGLQRLGREDRIGEILSPAAVPPAPGQGAIAIQVRRDDRVARSLVGTLDDPPTRAAVTAERAFLTAMGGGCRSPLGALAEVRGSRLRLAGAWTGPDGTVRGTATGDAADPEGLGRRLARRLLAAGPGRPLGAAGGLGNLPARARVLVTRPASVAGPLVEALRAAGLEPVVVPTIRTRPLLSRGALGARLAELAPAWIIVSSAAGAGLALAAWRATPAASRVTGATRVTLRWAAVGRGSAAPLLGAGLHPWLPAQADGPGLAEELPFAPGERLLVIRPEGAGEGLARRLTVRGAEVHEAVAYRTEEGPTSSVRGLRLALAEARPAAVILTSGSAVRGLVRLAGSRLHELLDVPVICIGRPTAGAARAAGFRSVTIAAAPTPEALAAATAATLEVAR